MRAYSALVWIVGAWICLIQTVPSPEKSGRDAGHSQAAFETDRRQLRVQAVHLLEDLVQRERFYHRWTGAYTPSLGRLEFTVPEGLQASVQIQVMEFARDRLLVRAVMDSEQIWMNQSFHVHSTLHGIQGRGNAATLLSWEEVIPELVIEQWSEAASTR